MCQPETVKEIISEYEEICRREKERREQIARTGQQVKKNDAK